MKKILESKIIKAIVLILFNLAVTTTLVFTVTDSIVRTKEEAKTIKLITGVINIKSEVEEFDENAKVLSQEGVEGSNSISGTSSSQTSGLADSLISGNQGNTSQNSYYTEKPNYAALTGLNLRLNEGDTFNPLVDLKIRATDIDGTDITNKVTIINGNIDTNRSGYYSISAKVKLQNNTELVQTFYVEVNAKPLRVNVSNVTLANNEVEQSETVTLKFKVDSSKPSVVPTTANVNGVDYPIIKHSNTDFSIELMAPNESKVETISLNSIQMSDGSIISVNHKMKLVTLKQMPTIEKLKQTTNSKNGKTRIDLKVVDFDSALETGKPITAILYDENHQELQSIDIYSLIQPNTVFSIPKNGKYYVEVLGYVNRNHTTSYELTSLYKEEMLIETIDKSSLEGKDVSIKEGESFDAIRDLQLKATNEDGEDITTQISIESDVVITTPGVYEVKASILKSDGQKVEKIFKVIVESVTTNITVDRFESPQGTVIAGTEFTLNLDVSLSKDYVEVERVIIDGSEYVVEKLDTDFDSNKRKYQVLMLAPQTSGVHELILSKAILSNGEELTVNEKATINLTNIVMYNEPLVAISTEEGSVNGHLFMETRSYSTNNNQTVTGPGTQQHSSKLEITGQVHSSDGSVPVGQISVTLPTVVGFVVDQDGNLTVASNMSITNNSSSTDVSVSIVSFTDKTQDVGKGITVVDVGQLKDKDRSFVSLALVASGGVNPTTVHLSSKGFTESKLVDINANSQVGLVLSGQAGKNKYIDVVNGNKNEIDIDNKGVSDQFTLVFKITKNN